MIIPPVTFIPSCASLLSLSRGVAQFLGRGMGGWLCAVGGAALAIWVLASAYLAGAGIMSFIPNPQQGAAR